MWDVGWAAVLRRSVDVVLEHGRDGVVSVQVRWVTCFALVDVAMCSVSCFDGGVLAAAGGRPGCGGILDPSLGQDRSAGVRDGLFLWDLFHDGGWVPRYRQARTRK